MMKAWVTKYALTTGILEMEGEVSETSPGMFSPTRESGTYQTFYHKPFWHESAAAAVEHAEKLRAAKLKSLEKASSKLKSLRF
jgi:hypothetical protein